MKKKVMITETILRDAHQSQAATRMKTEDMIPVLEQLDNIGYYSLEAWGGATFDSCLRFLNEDPWERLRTLKKHLKKTKIQMLLRGQNLLGYKHYSDDVVEKFVEASIKNGVDVIRVFDALNDERNLEVAMKAIKKYGGICEATICYTTSPLHTNEYFINKAKTLEDMGADNICIKDMSNILLPYTAYELVKGMKKILKPSTLIHLHTHNTSGTGDMVNMKAIEAGCDIVDCALSSIGSGTSQPATESLVASLMGTEYDTGIDLNKLVPINDHFKTVAKKLEDEGSLNPKVRQININTLINQVPGGMLSNLMNQLKQAKKLDKLDECLAEVPNVRKDCGYPPLVTPSSQIVGTQAVLNVLNGERYKMVTKEFKDLMRGAYGKLPGEPNKDILAKVIGDEKVIDYRPADDIAPEYEKYKEEIKEYITQEEDVLSYALFNQVAINFFKYREAKNNPVKEEVKFTGKDFKVTINGKEYICTVEKADGQISPVVTQKVEEKAPVSTPSNDGGNGNRMEAPMPGMIKAYKVQEGAIVKKGDVVLVLEAMKMDNDMTSPADGKISFKAAVGSNVDTGDLMAVIS